MGDNVDRRDKARRPGLGRYLKKEKISRRDFLRGMGLTSATAFLAACTPRTAPSPTPAAPQPGPTATAGAAAAPRRGGVIRFGMTEEPSGPFHPLLALASTMYYNHWVYESLVDVEPNLSTPVPRLAETWTPEQNGAVWVFNLRKGVKWHHGREFVADDVVATFAKIKDPNFGAAAAVQFEGINAVEKVDDHVVRFTLRAPNADLPIMLSYATARMIPQDRTDEQIEHEPSGTGPFRIDRYDHADRISFRRNEEYWMPGVPYVDEVEFVSIPEPTTMFNALQAGEVDIYYLCTSQIIRSAANDPNTVVNATIPASVHEIYMDITREPFSNDNVRRAFKLIGDHLAMARVGWPDLPPTVVDDNPVLTTSPYHLDSETWKQDLAQARRLIEEAGYGDGLEVTLWAINDVPGFLEFSLAFAEWAREIGVTVNVEGVKADPYYSNQWYTEPFGTVEWWTKPTVDQDLRIPYYSTAEWNETRFKSAEFDKLLDDALAELDQDKRRQMYQQAQQMLIEQGGQIIPYHVPIPSLSRRQVQGYVPHPNAGLDPRQVWLAES